MSFSGRVTFDADQDNTENASGGGFDAGIEGVRVELLNGANEVIAVTFTDATGAYSFAPIPNGFYSLRFPTSIGDATLATPNIGSINEDSDAFAILGGETAEYQVPASSFGESLDQIDVSYGFYSGGGPDGTVDGAETAQVMDVGFRDDDFDQITEGNDIIFGNGGNDTITAGGGDDVVSGGAGSDQIDGGLGDDILIGDDFLADPVTVDNSTFDAGSTGWTTTGAGTFVYNVLGNNAMAFNAGNNGAGGTVQQTVETQVGGRYDLSFDAFEYDVSGGAADHTLQVQVIDANGQVIATDTRVIANETGQSVTIDFVATTDTVTLLFSNPTSTDTNDTDLLIDNVLVTAIAPPPGFGNDTLLGGDGNDSLFGGQGDDQLFGDAGNDFVEGNAGDDTIDGGAGNDVIYGDSATTGDSGGPAGPTRVDVTPVAGADQSFVVWSLSDATIVNAPGNGDPFASGSLGEDDVAGSTFTLPGGVTPTTVGVTDNDTLFTDGDNGQQLVEGVTLNGTFVPAGETLEIEYSYSVQDSSGNVINIFAVEQSSSSVVGFISDQPLTLDETYTFIERTSTDPEIPYSDIATAYFDPAAVVAPPTGGGDDTIGGADVITGGDGNDSLFGGAGADSLSGGDGNDLIEGGDTAGSFVYVQTFNDGTLNGWQLDDVGDGTLTGSATAGVGGTGGLVFDDAQGDQEFLRAPQEFLDALPGSGDLTAATLSFDLRYSSETDFTPVNSIVITGDGQTITLPYTLASGQAGQFQTVTVDLLDAAAAGVTEARLQEILANITDLQIAIDVNVGFPAGDEVFIDNITLAATTAQDDNDTLLGGSGADTLLGEAGDDSLSGDAGSDSLSGGDGDDLLSGGADADILEGGQGSDTFLLSDGFGNDTITGGEDVDGLDVDVIDASGVTTGGVTVSVTDVAGSVLLGSDSVAFSDIESFTLTDQADSFTAFGNSAVTVDGGDGDDTIREGNGDNLVDGGAGSDRFIIGFGTSTITGGEDGDGSDRDILSAFEANDGVSVIFDGTEQGSYTDNADSDSGTFSEIERVIGSNQADTIDASLDNSAGLTLSGAGGEDSVVGGSGEDFISGGAGADTLTGGAGGDALIGDEGDDVIDGGAGADFIEGGAGNDLLTGGDGDDFFSYLVGDGLDTITDFNTGNTGTLNDNDSSNNDFIDLSAFFDNIAELQDDYDDDGVLNQSNAGNIVWGQVVDYSDNTSFDTDGIEGNEGIVFDGGVPDGSFFTVENTGVICFAKGTLILTPRGEVPVERLREGDLVVTRDNGPQPIAWIGSRHLTARELDGNPKLKPVFITPETSGGSAPLIVSPQHGVLQRLEGEETLVRATHLARMRGGGARVMHGCRSVTYVHLMFEAHQIVFAAGAASESFFPGPQAIGALAPEARAEMLTLFPGLKTGRPFAEYCLHARDFARFRDLPDSLRALGRVAA